MGLFSKELQILDKNTVQYMIDQMQDTIDEQQSTIQEQQNTIKQKSELLASQEVLLQQKESELEQLKKQSLYPNAWRRDDTYLALMSLMI